MTEALDWLTRVAGVHPDLVAVVAFVTLVVWGAVGPVVHSRRAAPGDPADGPFTGPRVIRKEWQAAVKLAVASSLGMAYAIATDQPPVHGVLAGIAASKFASVVADIIRGVKER